MNVKQKLKRLNPACVIARNLFGENHTIRHKMISGIILMVMGVFVAKLPIESFPGIHYLTDVIGYGLHGMGGIPFGEYLSSMPTTIIKQTLTDE